MSINKNSFIKVNVFIVNNILSEYVDDDLTATKTLVVGMSYISSWLTYQFALRSLLEVSLRLRFNRPLH